MRGMSFSGMHKFGLIPLGRSVGLLKTAPDRWLSRLVKISELYIFRYPDAIRLKRPSEGS
jgi:hypothetical protein